MILFVDDDVTKRYACTRPMRKAGLKVIEASSGAEALKLIKKVQPRAVVADAHLGDMDGYELCHRVKSEFAVPVILVSASPGDAKLISKNRVDAYIDTYADPELLLNALEKCVEMKRSKGS
ncbi:MAG TPA: response regulator [Planctomycetota bacterium]|nr:response regulator [Planctomycetota bacterium]